MYIIYGKYQGETEEIDTAQSLTEAQFLIGEYRLAYGSEWKIWAKKVEGGEK